MKKILAIGLSMLSLNAFAVERQYWLIGPSFSSHSSTDKAPIIQPASGWTPCTWILQPNGAYQANRADCRSTTPITQGFSADQQLYYPQNPAKRGWNENNGGIGAEVVDVYDTYKEKYIIDYHRDSLYNPAIYVGYAKQYRLIKDTDLFGSAKVFGKFNVDIGLAAGLWWRSYATKNNDFDYSLNANRSIEKRMIMPTVFPVATMEIGRVGFNIMYAPKIKYKNKDIVPTNIIMYQFLLKF